MTKPSQLFASNSGGKLSGSLMAMIVAAVAASVIGVLAVVIGSLLDPAGAPFKPDHILPAIAIALFWAPAVALIPAAIIGFLVERPKARAMIARRSGGLVTHVLTSTVAGAALALMFRLVLHLFDPRKVIIDPPILGFFTLIGFCSGLAWWHLVVLPGRRA